MQQVAYPVGFTVDYPDRRLDRLTTAFRIFVAIPHYIVPFFLDIAALVGDRGLVRDLVHRPLPEGDIRLRGRRYPLAQPRHCYAWVLVTDRYPPFRLTQ
jgi:hypothetical protein